MFKRIELRKFNIANKFNLKLAYIALLELENFKVQDTVTHNITEIMYVKDGLGAFEVEGKTFNAYKGDLLIVNPDTLHCERAFEGKFSVYIIGIENYVLTSNLGVYEPINLNSERIGYYLEQLFIDYERQGVDFVENITCLFSLIINEIALSANYTPQMHIKSNGNEVTKLIKKYIDEHFLEDITIEFLSRKFFANKTTLMHNFKKYVGTSIKAYVIEKRLEDAVNWLKISNLTATEICYRTGFQTPAYFSKYFKKKYKLTPNEYRLKFNKELEK